MSGSRRVAFITGGTRGIGRAICKRLAVDGHNVAVGYNGNEKIAREVVQELQGHGIDADCFRGSVENYEDIIRVINEVIGRFGQIDILVNNAGITSDKTLRRMSPEQWIRVVEVNLFGTFHCSKCTLEHMLERRYGRIINMSSIIGLTGNVGQANYAAAKAGIIGFSKSLALEMATKGITVNVVAPGFIETEMTKKIPPEVYKKIKDGIPMKRFGSVEEVARLVRFIAAEESGYITGQVYSVNGGLHM